MDHYFSPKPKGEHHLREIGYSFRGRQFRFLTDDQVFSKDHVDFGSSLLIETMRVKEEDHILDLGAGYGPIGIIAASMAPKGKVVMVEINERAVRLAEENLKMNGIINGEVYQSDGTAALPDTFLFDVVVTNPPIRAGKQTVFRFYDEAYDVLREGGTLWVVIQKKQGADSTERRLKELFPIVERVIQEKGYRIYRAKKSL